jgi:VIT1/CCC1 family predicted Fe2+/Mn2+ transporter
VTQSDIDADIELGIDSDALPNPRQRAISSAIAFALSGAIPVVAILLPPRGFRVSASFGTVFSTLVLTGTVSAALGRHQRAGCVLNRGICVALDATDRDAARTEWNVSS